MNKMVQSEQMRPPTGGVEAPYRYGALSDAEVDAWVGELLEHGYCILPAAIPPAQLQELRGVCAGLGASAYAALPGVDPAFSALATAPNILRIAQRICGEDCLLSSTTLSSPPPGTPEQEYHTDDLLYGRELFPRPLQHYLNVNTITALADFTAANGATKIIPGSHRWHEFPPRGNAPRRPDAALHSPVNEAYEIDFEARGIEVAVAEMKAGSTVFWLGATWHCRGPCDPLGEDEAAGGASTRHSLVFQYCRGNLRTQENSMVQLPHTTVAAMQPEMQRLCGYSPTVEGLGFAAKGFPAALLGDGGKELLAMERAGARDTALANYKRLQAHLDEHREREAAEGICDATVAENGGLEAELEGLESRAFTISQRMYEIRRELNPKL